MSQMETNWKIYNLPFQEVINEIEEDIIIVTDPPYNINFKYNKYIDRIPQEEYLDMLGGLIKNYPCVMIHYHETLHELTAHTQIIPDKIMEWIYNSNNLRHHRAIAYYHCKPDLNKVRQPYKNYNDPRVKEMIRKGSKGARSYDWWEIQQVKAGSKEKGIHPCQAPIKLMDNIIKVIPEDYVICDPFMGGGTTGVASLMNNRMFIGMELDELYFNEAHRRLSGMLI